jgi:hypothetical protein
MKHLAIKLSLLLGPLLVFGAVANAQQAECSVDEISQSVAAFIVQDKTGEAVAKLNASLDCGLDTVTESLKGVAGLLERTQFVGLISQLLADGGETRPVLADHIRELLLDPEYFAWFYGSPESGLAILSYGENGVGSDDAGLVVRENFTREPDSSGQ